MVSKSNRIHNVGFEAGGSLRLAANSPFPLCVLVDEFCYFDLVRCDVIKGPKSTLPRPISGYRISRHTCISPIVSISLGENKHILALCDEQSKFLWTEIR